MLHNHLFRSYTVPVNMFLGGVKLWNVMYVNPADMFMTRKWAILIMESNPALLLPICRKTGYARYAELEKMTLQSKNNTESFN